MIKDLVYEISIQTGESTQNHIYIYTVRFSDPAEQNRRVKKSYFSPVISFWWYILNTEMVKEYGEDDCWRIQWRAWTTTAHLPPQSHKSRRDHLSAERTHLFIAQRRYTNPASLQLRFPFRLKTYRLLIWFKISNHPDQTPSPWIPRKWNTHRHKETQGG